MLNYVALDKIFKSLGHPWRRHMIEWLCDREESASRLAEHLPHRAARARATPPLGRPATQSMGPAFRL